MLTADAGKSTVLLSVLIIDLGRPVPGKEVLDGLKEQAEEAMERKTSTILHSFCSN